MATLFLVRLSLINIDVSFVNKVSTILYSKNKIEILVVLSDDIRDNNFKIKWYFFFLREKLNGIGTLSNFSCTEEKHLNTLLMFFF